MIKYIMLDENNVVKDGVTKVTSHLAIFFEHILKWKYWNSEQCSSWTNSIFRSIYEISDLIKSNKNIYNRANSEESILKSYNDGLKAAIKASGKNISKLDNKQTYYEFAELNLVLDKDLVREWLLDYSTDKTSDRFIDNGYNNNYYKKG